MTSLIEEIEELKHDSIKNRYNCCNGYSNAINDVKDVLSKYNVLTVPKEVKLSKILKFLNESGMYMQGMRVVRDKDKVFVLNYQGIVLSIGEDKKIRNFNFIGPVTIFKDIYIYWFAETLIIDDMREVKGNAGDNEPDR